MESVLESFLKLLMTTVQTSANIISLIVRDLQWLIGLLVGGCISFFIGKRLSIIKKKEETYIKFSVLVPKLFCSLTEAYIRRTWQYLYDRKATLHIKKRESSLAARSLRKAEYFERIIDEKWDEFNACMSELWGIIAQVQIYYSSKAKKNIGELHGADYIIEVEYPTSKNDETSLFEWQSEKNKSISKLVQDCELMRHVIALSDLLLKDIQSRIL